MTGTGSGLDLIDSCAEPGTSTPAPSDPAGHASSNVTCSISTTSRASLATWLHLLSGGRAKTTVVVGGPLADQHVVQIRPWDRLIERAEQIAAPTCGLCRAPGRTRGAVAGARPCLMRTPAVGVVDRPARRDDPTYDFKIVWLHFWLQWMRTFGVSGQPPLFVDLAGG